MSAFDDLTLAEVDVIKETALGGKSMDDPTVDNFHLAGGVMWMTQRRENPDLDWETFKAQTRMADIKSFSIDMEAADLDPTVSR